MEDNKLPQIQQSNTVLNQLYCKSNIYLNDEIASGVFRREGIVDGYVYTIKYDTLEFQTGTTPDVIQHLDDYDRMVYDAICTLYVHLSSDLQNRRANKRIVLEKAGLSALQIEGYFSAPEWKYPMFVSKNVYQVIVNNYAPNLKLTENIMNRIEQSIDNLSHMQVDLKYHRNGSKDNIGSYTSTLISIGKHTKKISVPTQSGTEDMDVEFYSLKEAPILYDYAINNSMVSLLSTEKLKINASIYMTKFNIAMISIVRNKILNGSETVYIELDELAQRLQNDQSADSNIRKILSKIRKQLPVILDSWKESTFINDWNVVETTSRGLAKTISIYNTTDYRIDEVIKSLNINTVDAIGIPN